MSLRAIILSVLIFTACAGEKDTTFNQAQTGLTEIRSHYGYLQESVSIDSLIIWGYHELAHDVIQTRRHAISDSSMLAICETWLNAGQYEASLEFLPQYTDSSLGFDVTNITLTAALARRDSSARCYLDTLAGWLSLNPTPEKEFMYQLQRGYVYHNCSIYDQALACYRQASQIVEDQSLSHDSRRLLLRRTGNSFNDLHRMALAKGIPYTPHLDSALWYYKLEQEELARMPGSHSGRAINNITRAMLFLRVEYASFKDSLYRDALKWLVMDGSSGFLRTRHDIYTSIALTQLAEVYALRTAEVDEDLLDSLVLLNHQFMEKEMFASILRERGLNMKEYYNQRNTELILYHHLWYSYEKVDSLKLLNALNASRYIGSNLIPDLRKEYGKDYAEVVRWWLLVREWEQLHRQLHRSEPVLAFNSESAVFRPFRAIWKRFDFTQFRPEQVDSLTTFCEREDATLIQYLQSFGNQFLIVQIDATGLQWDWLAHNGFLSADTLQELLLAMKENHRDQYAKQSFHFYQQLRLDRVATKNLYVISDGALEYLPFEALSVDGRSGLNWNSLAYFGDKKNVYFLHKLSDLLDQQDHEPLKAEMALWYSENDLESLPFNERFISELEQSYHVSENDFSQVGQGVLHLMAHTTMNAANELMFDFGNKEVRMFNKELYPKVAVLHGCSSGNGNFVPSEGVLSLPRMFLRNGSATVIYSMWDVDNRSSVVFFDEFYTRIGEGKGLYEAMKISSSLIKNNVRYPEWSNPFYWGNFRMVGRDAALP